MYHRVTVNLSRSYRRAKLEGRPHLVVPCAMLKEGVLEGSAGPIFYPEEEISKNPESWNGMPIVIDHPSDDSGSFVTARQASVFNQRKVGVVLETSFDNKLRTECWFDEERVKKVDRRVYNAIVKKKRLEVSTGLDGDLDETPGEHNGTKYNATISNLRPDHLAILPDQIGALSVAQGGGLFANALAREPEGFRQVAQRSIENALKGLGVSIVANELSFSDRSRALSDILSSTHGEKGKYWRGWIIDVFDDYVVFENADKTWKQSYTVKEDVVTLTGSPVEVRRTVSYVANSATNPEGTDVAKTAAKVDKKAIVDGLIGNGHFAETERAKLMDTDESVLTVFQTSLEAKEAEENVDRRPAKVVKANKKAKQEAEEDDAEDDDDTVVERKPVKKKVANAAAEEEETEEDQIKKLPKPLRRIVANAQKIEAAQKAKFVKTIMNSKGNRFKKEWLEQQDLEYLEGVAGIAAAAQDAEDDDDGILTPRGKKSNYVGNAGAFSAEEDDEEDEDAEEDLLDVGDDVQFADPRKKR